MIITINQPAGLGDIFFCQKIAHKLIEEKNCDILWPVIKEFSWIGEYIKHPRIKFEILDKSKKYENVIKLDGAHLRHPGTVMSAKYNSVNIDFSDWSSHFNFERNKKREEILFYDILKLKDNEEYTFVNQYFASPPNQIKVPVKIISDKKIINFEIMSNDNIFDWCKVLEEASEIHTIQTALQYVCEKLDLKAKEMYIYQRPGWGSDFSYIDEIFSKNNWTYIV